MKRTGTKATASVTGDESGRRRKIDHKTTRNQPQFAIILPKSKAQQLDVPVLTEDEFAALLPQDTEAVSEPAVAE